MTTSLNVQKTGLPYRQLLVHRAYWRWSVATQLMRLPILMASLAFVLVGKYVTGSLALGGWMVTTYVLCGTVFAIPGGRLADKIGTDKALPLLLSATALVLFGLATAVMLKAPEFTLLILVGMAGAIPAGVGGAMRSLLNQVVPHSLLSTALSLDATLIELVVVLAPFVASTAALLSPPFAIFTMAAATTIAALFVPTLKAMHVTKNDMNATVEVHLNVVQSHTLWRNRRFVFWLLVSVAFGQVMGTAETGALPLATRLHGTPGTAAMMLAVLSVSSALGGLGYAGFAHRLSFHDTTRTNFLLACMVTSCVVLALSTTWFGASAAMAVLGACTAPLNTVKSQAADSDIPSSRKSEGFSLLSSAHSLGYGLGGVTLATLPLVGMILAGGLSALVVIALTPVLMRRKSGHDESVSQLQSNP